MVKIKHLVVDTAAFIKNVPLHELAENIYTVNKAVKEIKDKNTRERLQFLPYTLKIKDPCPEAYKHVLEFSKLTGDYATLSVTDLQIIALTYQLEKENVGTDHLNKEPTCKVTTKPSIVDKQLSGFFYPKKIGIHSECEKSDNSESEVEEGTDSNDLKNAEEKDDEGKENIESEDNDDDDDDEEGWITAENIHEMQKQMGAITFDSSSDACVACIATDFAVQNVLLQIGLNVTSVDGMLIKNARIFILRCYACYKTTSNMTKQFCPNCGNKTLKRVAITYNDEGSKNIHINFRKPINIRGTRYSLPTPQGGKHSTNPVLVEDQRIPENKPPKVALQKIDALSAEYETLTSPFIRNDIYSRAAHLGIRAKKGHQKKNPNEWSIRTGNRKKK